MQLFIRQLLVIALCASGALAAEPSQSGQPNLRRYSDGPLTSADFRGQVPASRNPRSGGGQVPLSAYTFTEIRYDLRYQTTRDKKGWTARLTSANAYAIMQRDQSWNLRPQDVRLLDHEQGHFDIAQSFALALQLYFDELRQNADGHLGTGETSSAAIRNLEEKMVAQVQPYFDNNVKAQEEYDRITEHGLRPTAQAEQRRLQLARIAESVDKLKARKK